MLWKTKSLHSLYKQYYLCQNVKVFLPKKLPSLFQMQEKLETCQNSSLTNLRRPSLWDDINVTIIL